MSKKSSSFFHVDEQVFFTMGALCVLSLVIMAFRFAAHTPCSPVKIAVNSSALIAGNVIRFNAATQQGKSFSWNFGDGTSKDEEISITNHEFKNAGRYTVTVLVNGQCSDMQDVVISDAPVIVNTSLQPLIAANPSDTAYINEPVSFSDISTASTKWEWRFGQTNSIDATDRNPTYTFTVPGRKTVKLKVNDRSDMIVSYSIMVIDRPLEKTLLPRARPELPRPQAPIVILPSQPHSEPLKPVLPDVKKDDVKEKVKAPALTNEQLKAMLRQVAEGQKRAEDFSEYLGGQLGISVTLNNNVMTFTKMCEELRGMKKIKEIKVIPVTDRETNHILSMNVVVEKKKLLGIF
ncbi:MAG: PKD domain-containing protein [Bacteroidota bacterium]